MPASMEPQDWQRLLLALTSLGLLVESHDRLRGRITLVVPGVGE